MTEAAVHPLVQAGKVAVVPGVYDVLSARMAHRAGFGFAVLTGYGVAASYLGEPDFGLLTQTEILDTARRILNRVPIGLVVDGDTGFGGPLNVQRMVRELIRMGASGVILEDQTWPKRCGHMRGKDVIDAEEHAAKIRAAVDARGDKPFVITARTDAVMTHGLDEAIRRAKLYKDAGATVLFVEGPRTKEEIMRVGRELPPPLAINLIEGGDTPLFTVEELQQFGFFSVGFVLSGLFAATHALERTYRHIRTHASTDAVRDQMMDFPRFVDFIGVQERYADDEKYRAR
ncbi:MAG: oxaloacetate decarboxylase [Deltaproteobacteria bacterium]|nr:oxaloacetate decarboxylase [Deltaproteobacteria bacterium]